MDLNHKIIGSGDPLVILHGLFGMLDNWLTLGRSFGESRMAVLVDQRNHGKSPHTEDMSIRLMSEDLSTFLSDNWMHEINLMGHSMGGKVAMRFALDYPDRVRKLIIVDIGPRASEPGHDEIFAAMRSVPLANSAEGKEMTRESIDELLQELIPQPAVRLFLSKNLKREKSGGYSWKMNLPVIEKNYHTILEEVTGKPWTGEALFIRGERSDYIRDEDWAGILALFPNAKLATVKGAGHWVHAEAHDEVLKLVNDFLAG